MAILAARNARMHSTEAIRHGRAFDVRASDVFVVTYPKCGTTWVSAIAHFLRGGDEDDFGEICEVMPWDIIARDCGQNCNDEQIRSPRLFKSHEAVWKSKFYGAFVLILRVNLHAIDAPPARWRGDASSSPLDGASTAASSPRNDLVKNYRVHPTHWLISTQARGVRDRRQGREVRLRIKGAGRRARVVLQVPPPVHARAAHVHRGLLRGRLRRALAQRRRLGPPLRLVGAAPRRERLLGLLRDVAGAPRARDRQNSQVHGRARRRGDGRARRGADVAGGDARGRAQVRRPLRLPPPRAV